MSLTTYHLLGRTGFRVSPLALGAMTFGEDWGWGASRETSRILFLRYLEAGGNFIDTADAYTGGHSEEFLGDFIQETGTRDRVVLATKYTFNLQPGNPNAGGNGRKNLRRALEGSLRRLKTDYVDLYWMHAWDRLTPLEEVVATLNDLVREGRILHYGFSDVPAWYASRAHTLAELRGLEGVAALQLEYSLISRSLEREHLPMARELGMALVPWSPLAGGLLTGKYRRTDAGLEGDGRVQQTLGSGNPVFERMSDPRNFAIVEELASVAEELGRTPAEVALNWVANRPAVASTLIGATRPQQLEANLRALEFTIPAELAARLDEVSRPAPNELDAFFGPTMQGMIHGGSTVVRRS